MKKILLALMAIGFMTGGSIAHAFESTYYVVRHAEKQAGDNPVLTQKGVKRAAHIAGMLKDEKIVRIFSTDTNRTIMTATPTAADKGLEVELFSTEDLQGFSEMLKKQEGVFLIVAHSSSTPDLTSLLANEKLPKLDESDFEKLFKVVIKDGKPTLHKMTTTFE